MGLKESDMWDRRQGNMGCWGEEGDDDDEDDTKDDEGNDDGDDSDGDDDSDHKRTESDRDENPNLSQFNEEHEEEEEENVDEFTDKEDDEEIKEKSDDGEELYKDVNVNLRKEDMEITNVDQGRANQHNVSQEYMFEQEEEDAHSSHVDDPSHTVDDSRVQKNQEFIRGKNDEQPEDEAAPKNDWFKKPEFASNRESMKDVYCRKRIIAVTKHKIIKNYDYGLKCKLRPSCAKCFFNIDAHVDEEHFKWVKAKNNTKRLTMFVITWSYKVIKISEDGNLVLGLKDFLVLLKLLLLVMVSTTAKVNAASEYGYYS
nr:hypothetical protein [Tanacetum cinerariifolium]